MELNWQLDNPAIALAKYCEDAEIFASKKENNHVLNDDLSLKQSELSSCKSELNGLQSRLSSMGIYENGDADRDICIATDEADEKITQAKKEFDAKQNELEVKKESDIQDNVAWLKKRLAELMEDNTDLNRELSDIEKKALEFETARRQFITESDEHINNFEDAITEEKLLCQTAVGELKNKQDDVYSKFNPDIDKFKKAIDSINRKYKPDIQVCQNTLSEKVNARNEEINRLQSEKNRELQLANNEIDGYKQEFKQTEKQFNEQIRMAKLHNKPTARMENSKVTRLNAINDHIQKINNRFNKKAASIDQKISDAHSKHAKHIEKAENQLNTVIRNKENELGGPVRAYKGLIQNRDEEINALQAKIDRREQECNVKVSENQAAIETEKQNQIENNAKIDGQIIEFVMSGNNCFSEVLDEQNAPFIALQGRIAVWMEMLSGIKKNKFSEKYQKEHDKQKNLLTAKEYKELQAEILEANQYKDKLSVFAKNHRVFEILGGSLVVLGIVLTIVLYAILKMQIGLAGITPALFGIILAVIAIINTNKEFSKICKYVSLASDYREFPSIQSESAEITKARELGNMKMVGDKLYNVYYGKKEAQNIYDAKDADIRADYERNIKLITKELENVKAQIERERDAKIKQIKDEVESGESKFNDEKENLEAQVSRLNMRIGGLTSYIGELKNNIDSNSQFIDAFENNYSVLEKQLNNESWIAPMSYTHGKLSESLYIVSEKGELDEYSHKKAYKITHNKKAVVINYDLADVEEERVEEVNKIIHDLMFDLMYSVYRMNSKETYAQFIVDGMAATNDLKSSKIKNAFNIVDVVGKIEDIRGRIKGFDLQREKLAEKGTTMDAVNESKFSSQDRPETYNILYIIFRPDERRGKLDEEIRKLIPDCDKYGFLPVFICEKETWDRESKENESIYKDIKGLANSEITVFDGKGYRVA